MNSSPRKPSSCASRSLAVATRMRRQAGFTLLELSVVTVISAMVIGSIYGALRIQARSDSLSSYANSASKLQDAIVDYVSRNRAALTTNAAVPGFVAPLRPTIAELRADVAGKLGNAFQGNTPTGGAWVVNLALEPACALTPATCDVSWLIYDTAPVRDNAGIVDIGSVATAARRVSFGGGFSSTNAPALFKGVDGTWQVANPLNAAGNLAIFSSFKNQVNANYVLMRDARDPQLQGNLTVAGDVTGANLKAINGVTTQTLLATNAITAGPNAATVNASITQSGQIYGAQGVWANQISLGRADTPYGVVAAPNTTIAVGPGAALSLASGSTVGARINSTGVAANTQVSFDQTVALGSPCTTIGAIGTLAAGQGVVYCNNTGVWANVGGDLRTLYEVCNTPGQLATDRTNGQGLMCRLGQFMAVNDLVSQDVQLARYAVSIADGLTVPIPSCGLGGTPYINIFPYREYTSGNGFNIQAVQTDATHWTVLMTDGYGNQSAYAQGIAAVGCRYIP